MKRAIVYAAVLVAAGAFIWYLSTPERESPGNDPAQETKVEKLLAEREDLDKSVWKNEVLAQEYEDVFVKLWDDLRASSNDFRTLGQFEFEELLLSTPSAVEPADLNVQVTKFGGATRTLHRDGWQKALQEFRDNGYKIDQTEWHHSRFKPGPPAKSTVSFVIHASNSKTKTYYIVQGDLEVEWSPVGAMQAPKPKTIDARNIRILERTGPPAFKKEFTTPASSLLVYDLNRDGLSDLIFPDSHSNTVMWNEGNFRFRKEELTRFPCSSVWVALLADVDGDGLADLVCADGKAKKLFLYPADKQGKFTSQPRLIAPSAGELVEPNVISAGDIDGDGDLDLWVAQYKLPYKGGQMPTPYYDANDGYPAYLLINNGKGEFTDGTKQSGLAAKRFRRTYSGCFVDIDDDQDLDLVAASDFAGLDVYENDGKGKFTDITNRFGDARHSFGMSLTFADYNSDAKLDFYMVGMSSTTARRLHRMGLGRTEFASHQEKRMLMGYGNRMFLNAGGNRFAVAPFNDDVARTGWSWGSTSFDFDNDGDSDLYVANGHKSRKSAKDYCTRFWCHDIYSGNSKPNPAFEKVFEFEIVSSPEMSWNGFEHNTLHMNLSGQRFMNVGFLMQVALEWDSRQVVSDDLDADGKRDLIVITRPHGKKGYLLLALKNELQQKNNWIGVQMHEQGKGRSPIGAKIVLTTQNDKKRIAHIVTGDSYVCQHANTVHFGLGNESSVKSVEVRWPDGMVTSLKNPKINCYHNVKAE